MPYAVRRRTWIAAALAVAIAGPVLAEVPEGCDAFSWNLSHEVALFEAPGDALAGGRRASDAPRVALDRVYAIELAPYSQIAFAHAPGKSRLTDGAHGALVALKVPEAGLYRVTIDTGAWVDVVRRGAIVVSNQFQGRSACPRFHKSVEYTLQAGETVMIQVTGGTETKVRLAVTRVP